MKLPFKYTVIMKITILTEKDLEKHMFQQNLFQLKLLFSLSQSASQEETLLVA